MKLKYERIARAESFGGPTQQRNKKMNEQTAVIGLMMEKLESFASVLGTTAEYLWGVLVAQAFVVGVSNVLIWIFLVIFGVILYRFWKNIKNRYYRILEREDGSSRIENSQKEGSQIVFVISTVILVLYISASSLHFLFNIYNTVTSFCNPEYMAFERVSRILK